MDIDGVHQKMYVQILCLLMYREDDLVFSSEQFCYLISDPICLVWSYFIILFAE